MMAEAGHNQTSANRISRGFGILLAAVVVFGTMGGISTPAWAQPGGSDGGSTATLPATCDPDYWEALKSRAWTEAQREIAQNQNLIYKPDSILEYTCFDRFLQSLSTVTRDHPLFSEESRWGTPWGNMGPALNALVADSVQSYISDNFGHTFLGGRDSQDYTPGSANVGDATYTCDVMAKIWQAAKCLDFNSRDPDGFFTLHEYENFDPRDLPEGFECTPSGDWAAHLSRAYNEGDEYAEETYNAYTEFFTVDSCDADPIPTGVSVRRVGTTPSPYEEHICINPGCAYDRQGSCTTSPP